MERGATDPCIGAGPPDSDQDEDEAQKRAGDPQRAVNARQGGRTREDARDDEIDRTSRGHDRRVPWRRIPRIDEATKTLKEEGYHLIALETTRGTRCYLEYKYSERNCLVLGNETKGILPATLQECDGAVFVPMYGKGPSMNVHVAAALVAYHALIGPH